MEQFRPPAHRDLVVVGGSAGGLTVLMDLVAGLPADLPATVLVGLHLPRTGRSVLAAILARHSSLPVLPAVDGQLLMLGSIVVAVQDRHLIVDGDRLRLGRGGGPHDPRPSHDVMFRSAALARGPRTVGVVLTGLLADGAAGLLCIHRYGGLCLVQDPEKAQFSDMPRHALEAVPSATVVPADELAAQVTAAVLGTPGPWPDVPAAVLQADRAAVTRAELAGRAD